MFRHAIDNLNVKKSFMRSPTHVLKQGSLSVAVIVGGEGKPSVYVEMIIDGRAGSRGGTVSPIVLVAELPMHVGNVEQLPVNGRNSK